MPYLLISQPTERSPTEQVVKSRSSLYLNLATLFCVLFGLGLILNIFPPGEGQWFWYAKLLHSGSRLYADMHFVLQPLFVLETDWSMLLFGDSWFASRLPALVKLGAFVLGLRWLVGFVPLAEGRKAILMSAAFLLPTLFVAYSFGDYHVLSDCFQVYSLGLLLLLHQRPERARHSIPIALILGFLSGLAITTRLNDGGILFLTVGLALFALSAQRRTLSLFGFGVAALLTVMLVVSFTGDTFRDYATYSIFKAAASKGGAGSVFIAPLKFPVKTLKIILFTPAYIGTLIVLAVSMTLYWFRDTIARRRRPRWPFVALSIFPVLFGFWFFVLQLIHGNTAIAICGFWVIASILLALVVAFRAASSELRYGSVRSWSPLEVLLLTPVGQLLSASMSSGGNFLGLYAPIGLVLILLAIATPIPILRKRQVELLVASAFLVVVSTVVAKARVPFAWHTFVEPPMFTEREWYRHPLYGPMYIASRPLHFFEPICSAVKQSTGEPELLSLPFPFVNYFCGVPQWHQQVQTFFDITSRDTIVNLTRELDVAPPKWIVYQRQPEILELHEWVYNKGKPLPHRDLDRLIVTKLDSGQWKLIDSYQTKNTENAEQKAVFMLIQTHS